MHARSLAPLAGLTLVLAAHAQGGGAFVENRGQWPAPVMFKADVTGAAIWLERGSLLIDRFDGPAIRHAASGGEERNPTVKHHVLRLVFQDAAPTQRPSGLGVQRGAYNFFLGADRSHWASGAHAFLSTLQKDLYPGIDARITPKPSGVEYDLFVAPGADPALIAFRYVGADRLEVRANALVIGTSLGDVTDRVPMAYQETEHGRTPVACRYAVERGLVRFELGAYDRSLPLVIDPVLDLSTYSGATTDNFGYSATYDRDGFLYGGSSSFGNGYPTTTGAYQTHWNGGDGQGSIPGTDIAITKFDTTGSFLIWSTMLGGSGDDLPHSLIVNDQDEVFVLGTTGSPDFPTTAGAYDNTFGGGTAYTPQGIGVSYPNGADMVVAHLSADGSALLGSTYLGGSQNDGHNSATALKVNYADEMRGEILLGPNDDAIIVSCTRSADYPVTAGAPQPVFGGGTHDGVVSRLNSGLTQLLWSTFIGGSGADAAFSGELDGDNELYICGGTTSTDLPTTPGAYRTSFQGGSADAFVLRYNTAGSSVLGCSYYGSNAYDQAYLMDLDQEGDPFLYGQTLASAGELINGASYFDLTGGQFIAKFDHTLGNLLLASRFGDQDGVVDLDISPVAFLVDYCDKLYVSGWGSPIFVQLSTNGLPVTSDAYQNTTDGRDFYLAVFQVDMSALSYATYFGGAQSEEHVDGGTSRFDRRGRVYEAVCAGCGSHDDFPHTPGAWSPNNPSPNCNLGVFKFDFNAPLVIAQPGAPPTLCAGSTIQFTNHSVLGQTYSWNFGDSSSLSSLATPSHTYALPGTYTVTLTAMNPAACNHQDVDSIQVVVLPGAPFVQAMNDTALCGPSPSLTLSCTSEGSATQFVWSTTPFFADTLNHPISDSTVVLSPVTAGTYYVQASTAGSCRSMDQVTVSASLTDAAISPDASICADGSATVSLSGIDPGSTITWSPADQIDAGQGTTTITVSPEASQTYTAQVTSPSGCAWTTSADVLVSPIFGSSVGASVDQPIVLAGTTVHLSATPTSGVTYSWSPAGLVSDPHIADPTAFITVSTQFVVTVSDGTCTRLDTVFVKVYELHCAEPDVFVPDAFTPNGDHNNDVLYVRGRGIATVDMKIFDRWGELVFETTDLATGWDGTYKGKAVDPDVYVYWLKVTCVDGQDFFNKGNVTVIR